MTIISLVIMGSMPIYLLDMFFTWHDSQRALQALLFIATTIGIGILPWLRPVSFGPSIHQTALFWMIFVWGLASVFSARNTAWAFTEWSLVASFVSLAWLSFLLKRELNRFYDFLVLGGILVICVILLSRFGTLYVIALSSSSRTINFHDLLTGFSNPRFFAQFATLVVPLQSIFILEPCFRFRHKLFAAFLLIFFWVWVFVSGSRGAVISLGFVALLFWAIGGRPRAWAKIQLGAIACALPLTWAIFLYLPSQLGFQIVSSPTERLIMSLSNRDILWTRAYEMMVQNPVLGVGPMHFADVASNYGAHPHQFILQWGAEWGIISLVMLLWLVGTALKKLLSVSISQRMTRNWVNHLRICLTASILSGLLLSLVDGVFVMPITQTWFSFFLGWLLALCVDGNSDKEADLKELASYSRITKFSLTIIAGIASLAIGWKVYVEKDMLAQRHEHYLKQGLTEHSQPRFWGDGLILWD